MVKKDRSGPAGPVFRIQPNCEPPKRRTRVGAPGRWAGVFEAFDNLAPGKGVGVEVLNRSEANRLNSALNGHAHIFLNANPDAGWRVACMSEDMPNGHTWFYGEKRLTNV